jgi:hypothetical protein
MFYLFRLCRSAPDFVNPDIINAPMKAAGITPGPALAAIDPGDRNAI